MPRFNIRASRIVEASIDTVWNIVSDHRGFSTWTIMTLAELEREGAPDVNGVGAIRRLGNKFSTSREEIVEFEPPVMLSYTLLSGLPLDDYQAYVRLSSLGDKRTRLTWEGSFTAGRVKGALMQPFLSFVLGDFVRRVAKVAPSR